MTPEELLIPVQNPTDQNVAKFQGGTIQDYLDFFKGETERRAVVSAIPLSAPTPVATHVADAVRIDYRNLLSKLLISDEDES